MSGSETSPERLTFEKLPELRGKTEIVSRFLQEQLQGHLETLRPILSPERLIGKTAGPKAELATGERALAQLQQNYRPFTARPFDLPSEFDQYWLTLVGNRVALYPWEYVHSASNGRDTRSITMTSPVRWVVSYASGYTLSQFREAVTGKGVARPEHVRQFVVNALVTQLMFAQTPGLGPLFADLRYQVQTDSAPDLPKLPLTTITSVLPSFRPSDDLILAATNFSGVPAFIEIIDIDAVGRLPDPLRDRLEERLR